jgi:hypothetical protein
MMGIAKGWLIEKFIYTIACSCNLFSPLMKSIFISETRKMENIILAKS